MFGISNTIVAVCIVVIALTLVMIDMREDIFRKTFLISGAIAILGVGASFASMNPIMGLVLNIIILFAIVHQTVDNYKAPMYFPFVLSYVFMLMSAPVTYKELPLRVVSIIIGSVYVLLAQLVLNRNRFEKTISGTRQGIILNIKQQIDNILDSKYDDTINSKVDGLVNTTVKAIYDTKSKKKYITEKNKGNLDIALILHKLNKQLITFENKASLRDDERKQFIKIKEILDLVNKFFENNFRKDKVIEDIDLIITGFSSHSQDDNLISIINELPKYLKLTQEHTDKSLWKNDSIIKNAFKQIDIKSLAFKFALKMSISVSVIIFLIDTFNIEYGRWIIFPMIAIIQPYYDVAFKKAINRIVGTILGIILFTVIFTIIKDSGMRLNCTIFVAYIGVFITKYQYSTSLVAISALGASALGGGGIEILFYRILFTLLGCAIAMIVNKYILHYRVAHSLEDLIVEYNKEIAELEGIDKVQENENRIYNLILNTKLMEYKINLYNKDEGYA